MLRILAAADHVHRLGSIPIDYGDVSGKNVHNRIGNKRLRSRETVHLGTDYHPGVFDPAHNQPRLMFMQVLSVLVSCGTLSTSNVKFVSLTYEPGR